MCKKNSSAGNSIRLDTKAEAHIRENLSLSCKSVNKAETVIIKV